MEHEAARERARRQRHQLTGAFLVDVVWTAVAVDATKTVAEARVAVVDAGHATGVVFARHLRRGRGISACFSSCLEPRHQRYTQHEHSGKRRHATDVSRYCEVRIRDLVVPTEDNSQCSEYQKC